MWLRRMRDGPKLALSRSKETDVRPGFPIPRKKEDFIVATQATDDVVFGMTLCILVDRICDLKVFLVYHR